MQFRYPFAIVLTGLATAAFASTGLGSTGVAGFLPPARSYFEARVDHRLAGRLSIERHLEEVERHLRAYPPAGLTPAQSAARAARLEDLRAYRLRGEFPQNLDFPDRIIPYFIDARGIACAVGHLMLLSGGSALAEEIARTRNHAYIPEIEDARLQAWARENGLTPEECARIQPSYPPRNRDVLGIGFDTRHRPWVVTGSDTYNGTPLLLSRVEPQGWSTQALPGKATGSFCMLGDRTLLMKPSGFYWNGEFLDHPGISSLGTDRCEAAPDGRSFWVSGLHGMRRFTVEGQGPPLLVETVRAGAEGLPSDTVSHVAVARERVWAGTSKALAWRTDGGAWGRLAYASLGGLGLGGLRSDGGPDAWLGLHTSRPEDRRYEIAWPFSENGLHRIDGNGKVTRYHRGNSALPGDTILVAAPAGDGSVWLSCDWVTLYRFTPPHGLAAMPFRFPFAWLLKPDGLGRLVLGTRGGGLYRVEGDSLAYLGFPTGVTALAPRTASGGSRWTGWRGLLSPGGDARFPLDVLGRRAGLSR